MINFQIAGVEHLEALSNGCSLAHMIDRRCRLCLGRNVHQSAPVWEKDRKSDGPGWLVRCEMCIVRDLYGRR